MLQKHQNIDVRGGENALPAKNNSVPQKMTENKGLSGAAKLFGVGVVLTIAWLVAAGAYIWTRIGWPEILTLAPFDLGILLLGAFAPLAFLWLLLGYFNRGMEARLKGNALDQLLASLGYPSAEAEARVARLTEALERHSKALQTSTDAAATRIETVTGALEKQGTSAGVAADNLLQTSDRLKTELEAREAHVRDLIDRIDEQGVRLNDAIKVQSSRLETAAGDAESRSIAVQAALTAQVGTLERAIAAADTKSQDIARLLAEISEKIFTHAARTLANTSDAKEALGAEIVQLEGAAERLRAKLDEGAAKLGERGQEIEEISRSSSAELAKTADILLQSTRSEEHTSELQSRENLVCRLLLEKKKK